MLPANISAARRHLNLAGRPATPLTARIPMQVIFVAAAATVAIAA